MRNKGSLGLFCLLLCACSGHKADKEVVPVTQVRQGTFYIDLYEEGDIQAVESRVISSPEIAWRYASNLKIATLVDDGTEVQAGDTLITFDETEVRKAIVDAEQRLEISQAELEKMIAQHRSNLEGMEADYEVSSISLEISRLNLESSQYEAEITRRQIQLNLEQAELSLEQAANQIENTRRVQQEELRQKKLNIKQNEAELADAYASLQRLSVLAPSPGIAILRTNWNTNAKFQEGEQVWSGQALLELPNLRDLKVELNVNEVDISKVTTGLKVIVRPDAFSDSTYMGEVTEVANLAVNKTNNSKIKVFPVTVHITSPVNGHLDQAPDLMPGLTVSCRILVDEIPDRLFIPVGCLFQENGEEVVYVKTAGGFCTQKVRVGRRNTDYVIIEEGLDARDEVAMVNPFGVETSEDKKQEEAK